LIARIDIRQEIQKEERLLFNIEIMGCPNRWSGEVAARGAALLEGAGAGCAREGLGAL
jgi:hypothetical protein